MTFGELRMFPTSSYKENAREVNPWDVWGTLWTLTFIFLAETLSPASVAPFFILLPQKTEKVLRKEILY